MNRLFGYLINSLVVSLFLLFCFSSDASADASAAQATLAWNQSSDSAVIGYKLYYGNQSGNYPGVIDAGANLSHSVTGLSASQAAYFAVTAYTSDAESSFSQELVSYFITAATPTNGQITPGGTTPLPSGSSQTFSIVANAGYQIADVLIDGVSIGAVSQYTFAGLSACHSIAANFISIPTNYSISASIQGSGSISPSGTVSEALGANQAFTITPAANYQISDVKVDNASVGAVSSYTFTNVAANHTIAVTFAPITYTIAATVQGSGSISPSGTVSAAQGTSPAFTMTPAANYQISDVKVDNASVGAVSSYTFTNVAANHTIAVTFAPITYTIAATVQGSGSISPSGTVSAAQGTSPAFTMTPAANYQISDVKVDNASVGAVSSYTFTNVSANHTIAVTFTPINFTIAATVQGSGSISPSGTVNAAQGSSPAFTMTPAANYQISDVKVDNASVGAVSSYTFTNVAANHTIAVTFTPINFTIAATVQGSGSISPSGTVNAAQGSSPAFTMTPAANYQISDVKVDNASVGAVSSYTFTNVAANHTIAVTFAPINFTIAATVQGSGSISPSGTVNAAQGSSPAFTMTPAANYQISDVKVDNASVGAVSSYTFTNVAANHTIAVTFAPINFTIAATVQGSGSISPSGTVNAAQGSSPAFTMTPAANYQISDVKVDNASVGAVSSYTFTNVAANHTIAVTFTPINFTIAATVQGSGSISPSGTVNAAQGSSPAFTMTPAANYQISDVKVDNASVGAVSSYTFTNVSANHTIAATFTPVTTYTIAATVQGSGSISPSGTVSAAQGSSPAFTITPDPNYKISGVRVDGKSIGPVSNYTFANVTANHTITASFMRNRYRIWTSLVGGGSISPAGTLSVSSGANLVFKIIPAAHHRLVDVLVDGLSTGAGSSGTATAEASTYAIPDVAADHTVKAIFSKIPPPVADAGPDQVIESNSIVTLNGSNSTDTVSGIASYKWTQVTGPKVKLSNPSAPICTFTAPDITNGKALGFNLEITNHGGIGANATCLVNVSGTDNAPLANAGTDQIVIPHTNVTLDGSGSYDPDGKIASYHWMQIQGPHVEILNANSAQASFVAPDPGPLGASLVFLLRVTDSFGLRTRDQCTVNVVNADQPPVAIAGPDQSTVPMSSVTLDGSGSYDPANSTDSYRWKQIRGVPVTLSDPTAKTPVFTAPTGSDSKSNDLLFMLTVTDANDQLSTTAKCAVKVTP